MPATEHRSLSALSLGPSYPHCPECSRPSKDEDPGPRFLYAHLRWARTLRKLRHRQRERIYKQLCLLDARKLTSPSSSLSQSPIWATRSQSPAHSQRSLRSASQEPLHPGAALCSPSLHPSPPGECPQNPKIERGSQTISARDPAAQAPMGPENARSRLPS